MEKEIKIIDEKKGLTPDNSTAIPNDLMDKYMKIFDKESQLPAVLDLIQQSYKSGLEIGRNESPLFAIIPMSILENKKLSPNAKLLYGEIMALSKRSGKCYATNEHLSDVLGLKRTSIPQLLRELSGSGLVIIDIKRNEKGTYRDIMVSFFNNGGCSNLPRGGIVNQQGQKRNKQKEIDKKNDIATPAVVAEKLPINDLIEFFKPINPSYERLFANRTQRSALERIAQKLGREKLEQILEIVPKSNALQYAPVITTPLQLEEKLGLLMVFIKKEQSKLENNKIIEI